MNKDELIRLIREKEQQVEKAKRKRSIITILVYAVPIFWIFYITAKPTGFEILGEALVAIFLSGILFLINATVFSQLVTMGEAERKMLEDLRKQLSEME